MRSRIESGSMFAYLRSLKVQGSAAAEGTMSGWIVESPVVVGWADTVDSGTRKIVVGVAVGVADVVDFGSAVGGVGYCYDRQN